MQKRSIRINGHATSVSLEPEFWEELERISAAKNMPLSQLIAEVDASRAGNLSSALRVYVLLHLKEPH